MASEMKTERLGSTLVLTLSDPATRNTLSEQLLSAGIEALSVSGSDESIRAVILRGDGNHFCAGGNLQGLQSRRLAGPPAQVRQIELLHRFIDAIRVFPKPVIAAVEGAAAGAGFSIALACDLIVAAEDARFVMSYAKIGLTPDAGATWHLARALPRQLTQQLIWLADPLSARQLLAYGVVNRVADTGQAFAEAQAVAARLSEMAPNAIVGAKELVNQAYGFGLQQQLDAERDQFVQALFHANGAEGMQSFFDKRPARFK